jgi:hypothetical protein
LKCSDNFSFSWHRKISLDVRLPYYLADVRSIIVDYLQTRLDDPNVGIVFFYFQYNDQASQTADTVASSLLKQLISQSETFLPELETLYDKSRRFDTRPDLALLIQLFISASKRFSRVFILFDAFDECAKSQLGPTADLVRNFRKSGLCVFATARIHLENFQQLLIIDDEEALSPFYIKANNKDIEVYVRKRLEDVSNEVISPILKKRITDHLSNAEGM